MIVNMLLSATYALWLGVLAGLFLFVRNQGGAASKRIVIPSALAAAVLSGGLGTVKVWEGLRTVPYYDIVGVLTVCYGETEGVLQKTYDPAECETMLEERLMKDYYIPIVQCSPNLLNAPVRVQAMSMSLAYNVGTGAWCGSTMKRLIDAGEWENACYQLPRWNKAGGVEVQGLTNRRNDEMQKCLGLKEL